ncbi:hypothetical protein FE257_010058 [Aspergillus nanangensis]|uniref:Uncharacterized protein n=1 Tax=Aspergillus nanangensis TaxID=2582783 RepID=A0AAD4CWS4_ASPNN|nr:hypothetical protein FE257_010058 [Aspergillus nanangensis]
MDDLHLAQDMKHNPNPNNGPRSKAFDMISKLEPSRGPAHQHWWNLTGPQLASMLEEAAYAVERQLEILLFYYHWIVPYLRHMPSSDNTHNWQSLLPVTVVPLEYSWKWDTASEKPEVRLTIEAFSDLSGTRADPLNQAAVMELLHRTKAILPDLDQTWINHFCATLFDEDKNKYVQEESQSGMRLQSTMLVAFEFGRSTTTTKTYLSPRRPGQRGFAKLPEYMPALQALGGHNRALNTLLEFLRDSPQGGQLTPFGLSFDNVDPASSRLKLYFACPNTSYNALREVLTLGGRKLQSKAFDMEEKIRSIHSLAKALMMTEENLPDDKDIISTAAAAAALPQTQLSTTTATADIVAERAPLLAGFQYYFDIAPGADLPDIRFYAPIRKELVNDRAVAAVLTDWLKAQGRGRFSSNYVRMMEALAGGKELEECHGLHSFIGCLIRSDGELDVTSYILPG